VGTAGVNELAQAPGSPEQLSRFLRPEPKDCGHVSREAMCVAILRCMWTSMSGRHRLEWRVTGDDAPLWTAADNAPKAGG
jgi:hypothetical protein